VVIRGELITSVDVPSMKVAANSRYRLVRNRAFYVLALIVIAASSSTPVRASTQRLPALSYSAA
jgi:CO/xanthine dehydrogenase FAD-binding subunit